MLILGMIVLVIIMFIIGSICICKSEIDDNMWFLLAGIGFLSLCIINPIAFGCLHGYTNYYPSNDKDLARITAVTMEQNRFYKTTL